MTNSQEYNVTELDELSLKEIEGGVLLLIGACIVLAAMCYYCGDHSAR